MILSTVRSYIEEIQNDNTTFEELFIDYVMYVQDVSIGNELDYILRHNALDPRVMENMVELAVGGFKFDKQ